MTKAVVATSPIARPHPTTNLDDPTRTRRSPTLSRPPPMRDHSSTGAPGNSHPQIREKASDIPSNLEKWMHAHSRRRVHHIPGCGALGCGRTAYRDKRGQRAGRWQPAASTGPNCQLSQRIGACASMVAGEVGHRSRRELGYSGLAQREGFRTPEALIQHTTGSTAREARTLVQVGGMVHEAARRRWR